MTLYARAAPVYREHGWDGVLPLPANAKAHPPAGYTGATGADPDDAQIATWVDTHADGNIALRLPDGVIGIDVDAYGDKNGEASLLALEATWGLLPATWRSTSRDDPISGIRLYRVPPGRYHDKPAPNIEIIQHHHRYLVVMPSMHPEGRPYVWRDGLDDVQRRPPYPHELAELPERWIEGLRERPREAGMYEPRAHAVDDWTPAVTRALTKALLAMPGGRHDAALHGALALIRLVELEHPGAGEALDQLGYRFTAAIADRSTPAEADREWADIIKGGWVIVGTTPSAAPKWEQRPPTADPADVDAWLRSHEGPNWRYGGDKQDEADGDLSPDLLDVINSIDPDYDWLVEGLLERGDRVIVTGPEGKGKSTLMRQIGVQLGSAIHPFTLEPTEAINVLLVDCENSRRQIRRKLGTLHEQSIGAYQVGRMRFEFRTEGLDLCRTDDRDWLAERVQTDETQLLIIGPLYKLQSGDPKDEQTARMVALFLDTLRNLTGIAMILEAHSPYADGNAERVKRPYGASLWSRWPEFGIHLAEDGKITHWRGQREERAWPAQLERGQTWPWIVGAAPTEPEKWDGPKHCMAAVKTLLQEIVPGELSARQLASDLRARGLSFRDATVRDAADRLVFLDEIWRREGPRKSKLYSAYSSPVDAMFSGMPDPNEEF